MSERAVQAVLGTRDVLAGLVADPQGDPAGHRAALAGFDTALSAMFDNGGLTYEELAGVMTRTVLAGT
jgi:hypothetical protein